MTFLNQNLDTLATTQPHLANILKNLNTATLSINEQAFPALPPHLEFCLQIGMGNGSAAKKIADSPRFKHHLIFEPRLDILKSALTQHDFSSALNQRRLHFITNNKEPALQSDLRFWLHSDGYRLEHIFQHATLAPGTVTQSDAALFQQTWQTVLQSLLSQLKPNEEDAYWGAINTLENFPTYYTYPHLNVLANTANNLTGIVVASGPSQKHSMDFLKQHQNRLVIVACDSAIQGLLQSGIQPDFVVTLERVGEVQHFFPHLKNVDAIPLVAPSVVGAQAFTSYAGPKLQIQTDRDCSSLIFGKTVPHVFLGGSASVAHLAYVVLRQLGCTRIGLIGQDLSYDPQTGDSHADSAKHVGHQVSEGQLTADGTTIPVQTVIGYDNQPKKTMSYWMGFANLYGQLIQIHGGNVFHVTPKEFGIPIPQTQQKSPADFFSESSPDKTEFKNQVHVSLAKEHKDTPSPLTTHFSNGLDFLKSAQKTSLIQMQKLSTTWKNNDMTFPRGEESYKKTYADLFEACETALKQLQSNPLWSPVLEKIILQSFLGLRVERASLLANETRWAKQTYELLQLYLKTFNLIQLWAARLGELYQEKL